MRLFLTVLIILSFCAHAFCEDTYSLVADKVSKVNKELYYAEGNVILKVRDVVFNSDNLTYNTKTNDVFANGNVKIISPTQKIEAEEFYYNIKTNQGSAKDIKGFLEPYNYICAAKMEKTGETTFVVYDARITTCPGDVPDWSFSMYKGELEIEGYMNADHASVNILNSPIVYFPKLIYPVSRKRQSGFLFPKMGYDSIKGGYVDILYYWAPLDNFDMTLGLGFFTNSGIQEQLELRYADSAESTFYNSFERIDDKQSEAGVVSRWHAIAINQYQPIKELQINLNADLVSDYLYTRDFGSYGISNSSLSNQNKDNMFYAEMRAKYFAQYANVSVGVKRNNEYRDSVSGYDETTIDQTPSISVGRVVPVLPYFIIDYNAAYDKAEYKKYTYNSTTKGYVEKERYDRFNGFTNFYFPIDAVVATITPAIGFSYTRWMNSTNPFTFESEYSDVFGGVTKINDQIAERYTGGVNLDVAFKEIYRDFEQFRHGIQNNISFGYSPTLTQKGIPNYLLDDIHQNSGSIMYELINFFKAPEWNLVLTLSQGYDMIRTNRLTPLDVKLSMSLFGIVSDSFEMLYNHSGYLQSDQSRMQYLKNHVGINITKYFDIYSSYTYDSLISADSFNTSVEVGAGVSFWRMKLTGYSKWQGYNKNVGASDLLPIKQGGSLTYFAECWSLGFEIESNAYNVILQNQQYKRNEIIVYLNFSFKGLSDGRLQFLQFEDSKQSF